LLGKGAGAVACLAMSLRTDVVAASDRQGLTGLWGPGFRWKRAVSLWWDYYHRRTRLPFHGANERARRAMLVAVVRMAARILWPHGHSRG